MITTVYEARNLSQSSLDSNQASCDVQAEANTFLRPCVSGMPPTPIIPNYSCYVYKLYVDIIIVEYCHTE